MGSGYSTSERGTVSSRSRWNDAGLRCWPRTTTAGPDPDGAARTGSCWLATHSVSKVRDVEIDPTDITPEATGGPFDIVLFLGVLYHLRDPMIVLERLRAVTRGVLVVETEVAMLLTRRAAAEFYPAGELNQDATNWWAPNVPATIGMLRAVGFSDVRVAWKSSLARRGAKWAYHRVRPPRLGLEQALTRDRFMFHARP